ncbi:MAG: anaerobic sulfite reductase subunit AsrA [Tissierellia bacterium]|nr:anaerobic sulfite reductase subunit AsrA [Tissierellia bacterium]
MGYVFSKQEMDRGFQELRKKYLLFGPKRFHNEGEYSDTDSIRYGELMGIEDLELEEKSSHTFKEILLPISETLFYFTEDSIREREIPNKREALVFVRSCDLHAVKRLDAIYLKNGYEDYFYKRLRDKVHFVLIGCEKSFENCFCVDMETNISTNYAASIEEKQDEYYMDIKDETLEAMLKEYSNRVLDIRPAYVTETKTRVQVPKKVDESYISKHSMWDEYDKRCIACGRCNFSCPTCTCFSMQDIFYRDNARVGERRRTWASCMVDDFTTVAGGGEYRIKHGQRMRFKVLHKVYDFKVRYKYNMCVGCGRCDDVCPEYISFSNAVNKATKALEEKEGGVSNDQ